ncbi:coiled-coil domain-containing protein 93 [Octopus sinensis]|uniref:Coiled-coil domain-containing protein 93 n=1 Tax=Octopus sinensis TaxID=2607531 RepID=A0A6P7TV18_9MOLL|nr:coiled-coil domain-containing protein 93 [Octopus sinensis]
MASTMFSPRLIAGSKLRVQYDADGKAIEVETREDEEQNVKLEETIELLRSAGYFRARIKGLTPFDKVVGGMTWCITTCNFDVDINLLFTENSSIGQKIALTEKIVSVLPKMKCPHRIEPHQIQGLDFIHIFPVVQWLVKRALETREEMGDTIRAYSIYQFNKNNKMPQDEKFDSTKHNAIECLNNAKHSYRPQRRYRRRDADKLTDEETRVISTLLEFGWNYGLQNRWNESTDKAQSPELENQETIDGDKETDEDQQKQDEEKINLLMQSMSAMTPSDEFKSYASVKSRGKISASVVGSMVSMQSDEIQRVASEYADKQSELGQIEKGELTGGVQHHKRLVTALNKQIQQQKTVQEEMKTKHEQLQEEYKETQENLQTILQRSDRIDGEMDKLNEMETSENQGVLEELRNLVAMNENLKKQEQEFKSHCKEEMSRLKQNIQKLKDENAEDDSDDKQRVSLIESQYDADKEKLQKIKLMQAKTNREIASLQRKIDDVPSRVELSQYQKRFFELYNQVAAKHKETKQFYTHYNILDDTKLYRNKEVNLLNSIHENFTQAMASTATKEQFLRQMEQIVEGVKQNRLKVEKKKQEEKMKRDQFNDQYLELIESQRLYFKTVKDFQEECRKNEILLSKLR